MGEERDTGKLSLACLARLFPLPTFDYRRLGLESAARGAPPRRIPSFARIPLVEQLQDQNVTGQYPAQPSPPKRR